MIISFYLNIMVCLIIGFILDCFFADPYEIPHPVVFIGKGISFLEKQLRKIFKDNPMQLKLAGLLLVFIIVFISGAIPYFILFTVKKIQYVGDIIYIIIQSIMFWQIIAAKSLRLESLKVYKALKENDIEKSRYAIGRIVGRDTQELNSQDIIKATVETVAENTTDGVIAPIIYCAIGGPVLGFIYKSINTMDSMVGYKNQRYENFGFFAAKLDDIANYIPARISAILMILSSMLMGFNAIASYKIWRRDRKNHKSPNSAQTESVVAGALGIQLGGTATYNGAVIEKPTIGDLKRPLKNEDIKRTIEMMYVATLAVLVLIFIIITISTQGGA